MEIVLENLLYSLLSSLMVLCSFFIAPSPDPQLHLLKRASSEVLLCRHPWIVLFLLVEIYLPVYMHTCLHR